MHTTHLAMQACRAAPRLVQLLYYCYYLCCNGPTMTTPMATVLFPPMNMKGTRESDPERIGGLGHPPQPPPPPGLGADHGSQVQRNRLPPPTKGARFQDDNR